jgi:hypothetical protein
MGARSCCFVWSDSKALGASSASGLCSFVSNRAHARSDSAGLTGAFCCLSAIQPRPGAQSESTGSCESRKCIGCCQVRSSLPPDRRPRLRNASQCPTASAAGGLFATPGPIASSERLFLRFAHGFFGRFARWCVEREWHVSIPPRILKAPEGSDEPMGLTPANARFNRQQKSSTYTARRHRGWFAKNLHVYLKRSLLFSITYTLNPYLQPL